MEQKATAVAIFNRAGTPPCAFNGYGSDSVVLSTYSRCAGSQTDSDDWPDSNSCLAITGTQHPVRYIVPDVLPDISGTNWARPHPTDDEFYC